MNTSELWAEALRLERAKAILEEGYSFEKDAETGIVYVFKPGRGKSIGRADYEIHPEDSLSPGCSCGDFLKRQRECKHMIAARLLQDEEAAQIAHYEEMARMQGDAENALTGCDPYARY